MSPARRPVKAVVVHHGTSCERRDPGERRSSIDLRSFGRRTLALRIRGSFSSRTECGVQPKSMR